MRLSSIKLSGFKSFVDPTALPLPSNLTAIVGPNGCGKSNLIDAVRWLLGETSMKELRGEGMEDVIFNGCKTRKPAGRAAVELVFDNSDGRIAGVYAAYSEISIKREYTRDGNSQYFLNGSKCLKRDVTDLFLGTGVAARSGYAIIEQGMVSRMVQAKPDELRVWLEEAAGISKVKERRRETESRIRQARENLARLNDLRSELIARLETLKKQAANAEKYKEFKEQERVLKGELLALRWRALQAQGAAHEAQRAELQAAIESLRTRVGEQQSAQAEAEGQLALANQQHAEQQARVYEAESQASRLEQGLSHARELQTLKVREVEQLRAQIEEVRQREGREQSRLAELTAELSRREAEAQGGDALEAQARDTLTAAEAAAVQEENRWLEFGQRSEQPLLDAEAERVRVEQIERSLAESGGRLQQLRQEEAALDTAALQTASAAAEAELRDLDQSLQAAQARVEALERQLRESRDRSAAAEGAVHETRQMLQNARGRLSSLETLQQAALREDDQEVSGWLRQQQLESAPRLASVIQVETGWTQAVEQVLGEWLEAPLLPELMHLSSGGPRTGLGLVQQTERAGHARAGRLDAKVQGPAVVAEWLANIHVAVSEGDAVRVAAALPPGESVITPDGVWRGRLWVRYPKRGEDDSGVLARGQLLKQLRAEVEAQSATVAEREATVEKLRTQIKALESEHRDAAGRLEAARQAQAQKQAQHQTQGMRLEQAQTRAQQLSAEIERLFRIEQDATQALSASRQKREQLDIVAARLREERGAFQRQLAQARETLQQARTGLSSVQGQRQAVLIDLASRRSALEALRQTLEDLALRLAQMSQRRDEQEREAGALQEPLQTQTTALDAARAAVHAAREELAQARSRVVAAENRQGEALRQLRQTEFEHDAARERHQAAQLEFQATEVRRQTLDDQIRETGLDRDALLQALAADAAAEAWDEKLAALGRRIERLGLINLAAIQELEEAQTRDADITRQHDDVVGALATLEEAIKKIDAETEDRFKITFDRVNATFQTRFPQLFGGGEAYLEMTGDSVLDTGVRVMARPPGKRNSSIQLLSGGEKTMTAVALLLALFELNPAPFCLLDEVDAALDDANVGRFVAVVREMSSNVQFIIITHNKITMELAQQLHGVTMQEQGVSRLVSVDVEQAVELAGKREEAEAA